MESALIPTLNAILNGLATVLLTIGFILIWQGRKAAHRRAMISALVVSALFLVGYVTHKIIQQGVHTPFEGEGLWRTFYYAMLISHVILAMAIAYLVPQTLWFAIRGNFERHRKWARWTFPIWYYVSVTGVLIYFFLYQWF
jgi:putative membrane protein